ncbi:NMD3 family protein [Halococcus morrhuae DSM 1307]|uniref:NMD3 family protein n=1 Tax=Halococcus morrhuae DSM 1307 TaxID=931277 RepID=M0MCA8_HALMO|nr:NMD3-related protein [Halococcus morrhuae]EMA42973.1 NMD3 family protein [Halococcus morrhuae DSM 1307]
MSHSRQFCPRCGDPVEIERENGERTPLCATCYFDEFELVDAPDRIEVLVCATCGAVRRGNRWVDVGARDYTEVAIDEVTEAISVHVAADEFSWQVDPEQVDENTVRMHCYLSAIVRGEPIEEDVTVPVKISRGTCTRCGRIAGDYYASTVQIRARGRTPTDQETQRALDIVTDYVAEREADGDRDAFITEIDETSDGADVKLSATKLGQGVAERIVRRFGGEMDESATLVTEDEDGNEVYRVTYAVHLPEFTPGDVIDVDDDDGPVLVESVRGNLKGVRVTTGEPYEAAFEDGIAPEATRLGRRADAEETTLVAVEDERAVQVLDPETYVAETIPRPSYLDSDADTIPVLKSRAGLHVLPAAETD